jgi:hypothetical protein
MSACIDFCTNPCAGAITEYIALDTPEPRSSFMQYCQQLKGQTCALGMANNECLSAWALMLGLGCEWWQLQALCSLVLEMRALRAP